MTDKELLKLAAKAAGIELEWSVSSQSCWRVNEGGSKYIWNPLTGDGDALRLAVKLKLQVRQAFGFAYANTADEAYSDLDIDPHGELPGDPYAATRRAIVRAAAEIGKTL